MFNGIIFNTGKIKLIEKNKNSFFINIETTITKIKKNLISFYISKETLNRSNFKFIKKNQLINLEKSLLFGQKISGHFSQGHVDTIAIIKKISFLDKTWLIRLNIANNKLKKFIVEKASISINGVSLTVSKVSNNFFEINVIPHTLALTSLKNLKINDIVNVELDIFSKYIYKYSN